MTKYYLPNPLSLLYLWVKHFKDTIPTYAAALGLDAAQVTALQASCDAIINKIDDAVAAGNAAKSARRDRDDTIKTEIAVIVKAIGDLKRVDGYTEAIGQDLGVIGEADIFDSGSYKPVLKAKAFPGYIEVTYKKLGVDGLNFYSRLKGTADWTFIGFDIESPFHDTRALAEPNKPETREICAQGVLNDVEIGLRSDIIEVTFGG